ncbi:hypothetical protein ACCD06_10510 [Azospirillum sp. CT11-132]|uniref:hypothetical protein n=1 Tax=Azospirillum sp. CT11-132 TaxID=3396317 RepID=UPI0039A6C7FD
MFDALDDFVDLQDEVAESKRTVRRCAYLAQAFGFYNQKLQSSGLVDAEMNTALLLSAMESYFIDVRRIKDFHGMERIDRYKIASYTLKWLCKIRPIQVGPLGSLSRDVQKRGLVVNADFALTQAFSIANINSKIIGTRLRNSILYSAHYRDIDGGVMAVTLEALANVTLKTRLLDEIKRFDAKLFAKALGTVTGAAPRTI